MTTDMREATVCEPCGETPIIAQYKGQDVFQCPDCERILVRFTAD